MTQSGTEYTVTVIDRSGGRNLTRQYKTVATSVKHAINNVAYRLGVHFCLDRPVYVGDGKSMKVSVVECHDKTVMML